jgi:hypothetical protein
MTDGVLYCPEFYYKDTFDSIIDRISSTSQFYMVTPCFTKKDGIYFSYDDEQKYTIFRQGQQ